MDGGAQPQQRRKHEIDTAYVTVRALSLVLGSAAQRCGTRGGTILRWYVRSLYRYHEIKVVRKTAPLDAARDEPTVSKTLAMVIVMVSRTLRLADNLRLTPPDSLQSRIAMMAMTEFGSRPSGPKTRPARSGSTPALAAQIPHRRKVALISDGPVRKWVFKAGALPMTIGDP